MSGSLDNWPVDHDEDDEEDADVDCGLTDEGLCMYAGSEWCDFECPYRDVVPNRMSLPNRTAEPEAPVSNPAILALVLWLMAESAAAQTKGTKP